MPKRIQQLFTAVAALAALALGGAAIASAQNAGSTPTPAAPSAPAVEKVAGPDTDNIQSGDQTTPDAAPASVVHGKKAVAAQSSTATPEAPGTEQPSGAETPGAAETPGSESAASDGPGGHADAPGSNVDHQFQGNE